MLIIHSLLRLGPFICCQYLGNDLIRYRMHHSGCGADTSKHIARPAARTTRYDNSNAGLVFVTDDSKCSRILRSGVRSRGRGLLSWFYHYCVDGVGVAGYDPILGAFSPPLRILFHISAFLMLWSAVISTYDSLQSEFGILFEIPGIKSEITSSLFLLSLSIYLVFLLVTQYLLPAVSDPGGPRPHRIQRQPQWDNRPIPLPGSMKQWRCVIAEESHAITEATFGESLLSGEPFGRDIWTQKPYNSKLKAVDEKFVHELASGGRTDIFNPSVNPNRYVCSSCRRCKG